MPSDRRILLAIWLVAALRPGTLLSEDQAQPTVTPSPPPAAALPASETRPGEVQEIGPKVYYLKDRDGNLVLVPDFTFERYEQLVARELAQAAPKPPVYSFADVVQFKGKVSGQQADLDVVLPLRFTAAADGAEWVRVPLQLQQGVLVTPPVCQGGGEVFLEYRQSEEGYVAWIRPKPEAIQRVTLRMKVPLTNKDGERHFVLSTLRTPTHFELEVPASGVEGRIGAGDENILTIERPDPQRTVLAVDGTGGSLALSWQERSERPTMLESTGSVLVAVNGQRIECSAKLKVRSYGSPIDSFAVRLPPDMELVAFHQPGLKLSPLPNGTDGAKGGQRILVRRLEGKTSEPIDVQLIAWRPPQGGGQRSPIEVGGFEVVDAIRQWGAVDIAVDGEWQVDVIPGLNVQRIDNVGEVARQQNLVARFEYYRQPCSLKIELIPKQTRLSLDPIYVFHVEPTRVRLDARLAYKMSGGRPREAKIDLGGWVLDRVSPQELISEPLVTEVVTPLRIPIDSQTLPGSSEFELRVEAHRDVVADQALILGPLRCPETVAGPALVVVAAADNTEIVPDSSATAGLIPDKLTAALDLGAYRQKPLVYRQEPSADSAAFVGRIRKREQSVAVRTSTRFSARESGVHVEQTHTYEVSFEPIEQLVFEIPGPVAKLQGFAITSDGRDVSWTEQSPSEGSDLTRIAATLPQSCLGQCSVGIQYQVPLTGMKLNESRPLVAPLVQPARDSRVTLSENHFELAATDNVVIEPDDDQWSVVASSSGAAPQASQQFTASGLRRSVSLRVTLVEPRSRQTTTVERAWLQVWLAHRERRDRAVFELTTSDDAINVHLPSNVRLDGIEVWLSGRRRTNVSVGSNRVARIPLDQKAAGEKVTVELFYWFHMLDPTLGRLTVSPPVVAQAERPRRWYWQLVLPQSEYLVWSPDDLTPETDWQWQGMYWGRVANMQQPDLERWLKASHQQPLPAATNTYLFSSMGSAPPLVLISAERKAVLLLASGSVLVMSLLLLYFPVLRHPAVLVLASVALGAVGLLYPDPAILIGQAAVVGIAMIPFSRAIRWVVARRAVQGATSRATVVGKADSKVEPGTRIGEGSSRTGTAPHFRMTAAESQS